MLKKINETIIKDRVRQDQYIEFGYAVACEDCTHFDPSIEACTFQFPVEPFLRRNQLHDLQTKGEIAFCRAMEID